jgi:hypothetical protein
MLLLRLPKKLGIIDILNGTKMVAVYHSI